MTYKKYLIIISLPLILGVTSSSESLYWKMQIGPAWEKGRRVEDQGKLWFDFCNSDRRERFEQSRAKKIESCPPRRTEPNFGGTLGAVLNRGHLECGVNTGLTGFAFTDAEGEWRGFDVGFCRALAAGIFGSADAVRFISTTGKTRFTALASGEVDVLARNTTWTLTRDVDLGFNFVGINYYDGQGFMVPKALGVDSAHQLDGATVCIQTGTTTELNLADFFRANDMDYEPLPIETNAEAQQNYLAGVCDVYTTDRIGLAAIRSTFENPVDHVILPETISKEPLGPLVREGDESWTDLVRWTFNALILAEEKGITQDNVEQLAGSVSDDPEINRLFGLWADYGAKLRLKEDWVVSAIAAGGNYGELYEKYLIPLGLDRGRNALYTEGGLLYAPPFR